MRHRIAGTALALTASLVAGLVEGTAAVARGHSTGAQPETTAASACGARYKPQLSFQVRSRRHRVLATVTVYLKPHSSLKKTRTRLAAGIGPATVITDYTYAFKGYRVIAKERQQHGVSSATSCVRWNTKDAPRKKPKFVDVTVSTRHHLNDQSHRIARGH
jgi:hypothetical protein